MGVGPMVTGYGLCWTCFTAPGRYCGVIIMQLVFRDALLLLTLAEKYILIMGTVKDKAGWQADKSR